jgi:hypothetical protein
LIQREIKVPIAFSHPRSYGADKHHYGLVA